ncbi:nitroreductase family protein [Patescibacteria group bacterium]
MEIFEVIKKRHCVRKFKNRDVSDELIERILDAARMAPSAGNLQSWYFVVVRDDDTKKKLMKAAVFQKFIAKAPVVIVSCANTRRSSLAYGKRGRDLYSVQDATIATQNMFLAVTALGLGACWVGAFRESRVQEFLSLKKHIRPIAIMPIGYSAQKYKTKSRRPLEKISEEI